MSLTSPRTSVALLASLALVACGGGASAPPPAPSAPLPAADGGSEGPAPSASAEPPKRPRKPFEIHNACTDVATVVFGENPSAPNVYQRRLAPSTTGEGPRDDDGNQTVWLLDGTGEPLVKVRVTRGMKRVEVGRSCRTLDAR